jgi:GntR family transcriptional regulator
MNAKHKDASIVLAALMREASAGTRRRTKRSAVRLAIAEAIRNGTFGSGDYLPPETWLTEILGVSLGTVQAALRQLQQMGTIVRRRGDGTRVASTESLGRDVWHFRFVAKKTGQPLRVSNQQVWIDRIGDSGEWTDYLGGKRDYVRIRRQLAMQDGTPVGAEMFLNAAAVPGLEEVDPRELNMVNIRPYLEEKYGRAAIGVSHLVKVRVLGEKTTIIFGFKPDLMVFDIHARAHAGDRAPAYFQRIIVSAEACNLSF